jgi:uncharacterized membrane-anchored protein
MAALRFDLRPGQVACVAALLVGLLPATPSRAEETRGQNASPYAQVHWTTGPTTAKLGDVAEIAIPGGYACVGKSDAKRFIEASQNLYSDELAVVVPTAEDQTWVALFSFDAIGHVKDDDRDQLDPDALLESLRRGNEKANEERQRRGWDQMRVIGWRIAPAYNPQTNNLEWAVDGAGVRDTTVTTNHSTRLLGRDGVMSVEIVCTPDQLDAAARQVRTLLAGYHFVPGKRYFEFKEGDKVAAVGLTGLVLGGAAVAAAKSGLLAKLFKPLLLVLLAGFAAAGRVLKGVWNRLTGRSGEDGIG